MSRMAVPRSSRRASSSSRTWAWMVTSSAVEGSSAMSRVRVVGESRGHHHALAHAARQLVGRFVVAVLGGRDADILEQAERLLACLGLADRLVCTDGLGHLLADAVGGSSEVSGSWKIMLRRSPRSRRRSFSGKRTSSWPSNSMRPLTRAWPPSRPMMASASVDLPQPDSPTMPTISPRSTASDTSEPRPRRSRHRARSRPRRARAAAPPVGSLIGPSRVGRGAAAGRHR